VNLSILVLLIFVVTLALLISGLYFVIEAPAEKKKLRQRILSAQDIAGLEGSENAETQLLRVEVMSKVPLVDQLLQLIPGSEAVGLFIQQSAVEITAGMLLVISLLIAWFIFLVSLLLNLPILLGALAAVVLGAIPTMVIAIKRQRRFLRFEELFPDAIDLLARAVRAGHAFTTGLDIISKELAPPVSEEFRRTYEQQNLGLPLRDAFQNLSRRMPLPDVRIFVTALTIQRETGGNLAEILDNLSHIIRERFKLIRQIKTHTAQGRLSMYMLVSVPPLMALALFILNREYIMRLFTDPLGLRFLTVGVIMQVVGYFVIRKIIQPKF
jgi:tight adherence protein B